MADLKKFLIILVVAVLFTFFVFTLIDAVYPNPDYSDYCTERFPMAKPIARPIDDAPDCDRVDVSDAEWAACSDREGVIMYDYDSDGCATSYECDLCQKDYNDARARHSFILFVISAIFGLLAIAGGVWLPSDKNELNEWVGTGFMFGGLISIFVGSIMAFGDLHRAWRPVLILLELALVLWLAYYKLGTPKKRK